MRLINRIRLKLRLVKIGCPYCLQLFKKDVIFESEKEFFEHLAVVHGIIRVDENTEKVKCPHCEEMVYPIQVKTCPKLKATFKELI